MDHCEEYHVLGDTIKKAKAKFSCMPHEQLDEANRQS